MKVIGTKAISDLAIKKDKPVKVIVGDEVYLTVSPRENDWRLILIMTK